MTRKRRGVGQISRDYEAWYKSGRGHWATVHLRLVLQMLPEAHDAGIETILDFACGRGQLLREMLAQGFEAEGTEVCEFVLRSDLAKLPVYPFTIQDFEEFGWKEFDAIFAVDVLDQLRGVEELDEFLGHVRRMAPRLFVATVDPGHHELAQIKESIGWWEEKLRVSLDRVPRKKADRTTKTMRFSLWA